MEQNYNLIFEFEKSYKKIFEGSDQFYLADPKNTTPKNNGGVRWGVKKESYQELSEARLKVLFYHQ